MTILGLGVAASGTKDGTPSLLTTPSSTDTSVNRISTKNLKRLSRSDIFPRGKYHLPFRIDDSFKNTGASVHAIIVAEKNWKLYQKQNGGRRERICTSSLYYKTETVRIDPKALE